MGGGYFLISFQHVCKTFPDGFEALKDINFHIDQGELVTLIGPSGCGKTTTVNYRLITSFSFSDDS